MKIRGWINRVLAKRAWVERKMRRGTKLIDEYLGHRHHTKLQNPEISREDVRKLTHFVKDEKRHIQKKDLLAMPRKISLRFRVYPREFRVIPEEKRRELIEILDAMIHRLVKVINAKKTKTRVRLRAMTVLNDLIKTSYTMVRDVEIEHLEREIAELESQAEQASGEEEREEALSSEG